MRSRFGAAIRLLICLVIVAGFYVVLLGASSERLGLEPLGHAQWLLLFVPLFLSPYLFDNVSVLVRGERHVFDATVGELHVARGVPIAFAQIERLQLRAVNGGCEELALMVCLRDGRAIELTSGDANGRTIAVAEEIAELVGVELTRS